MHFVRKDNETCFALTEELVLHYAALIFGKENVQEKCLFRVTRNADIDVKEGMMDHDIDYREIMADLLKRRRKLAAVRLQVIPAAPQVAQLLCSRLELTHKRVFVQKSPLDLSFFYKLTSRMESDGHPELFYTPARPMLPPQDYDLAAEVEKYDVLLSYPYQSIRPFIAMLKKAAQDPDVISIKMTLYRMARESQIVQALVEAAENGKEVVALVELRARFDEHRRGYKLVHRSRPVRTEDFYNFDLIIGMDDRNIDDLQERAPGVEEQKKIHRMTEYCRRIPADHVPDPYYGGAEGFEYVLDILEDACSGLLEKLGC